MESYSSWVWQAGKSSLFILFCNAGRAVHTKELAQSPSSPPSQWADVTVKPLSSPVNAHLISHSCRVALLKEVKSDFFSELKGLKKYPPTFFASHLKVIIITPLGWLAMVYSLPLNGSFAHCQLLAKKSPQNRREIN